MLASKIQEEYARWRKLAIEDADLSAELEEIADDTSKIEDAFYRDLAFGTGGLRGVIGAGTNRMNIYTVAKASQGLANYVRAHFPKEVWRIAVSYDSRIKSRLFAEIASAVFSANGITVRMYAQLMPTPCLSFAVRKLHCAAGVMITASHNPSKYNGYKVYGSDGCQITTNAAAEILSEIEKLDIFADVKRVPFQVSTDISSTDAKNQLQAESKTGKPEACGKISYIEADVYTAFINEVKNQSVLSSLESSRINKDVKIVYSPLNGTGLKPVLRTLHESGFQNITVVKEQEEPDGMFPTCPYPNPEIREAMALGIEYAKRENADLLLATDPDCDRVGIAVRDRTGNYALLSGNETGMLLLDYICARRIANGRMPKTPVCVKTIVTTNMAEQIAAHYGVKAVNVLTGFKFIGEQIGMLERSGRAQNYIFGFEESYGYLSGTYVRDKDAVNAAFLICEMFAYYRSKGISLPEKLEELYRTYGYCLNTLHSFEFDGAAGFDKMQNIMQKLRKDTREGNVSEIGGKCVEKLLDYSRGIDGLPKSDVLKYRLSGNSSVVIRPSGTEPKLKMYISVSAESMERAAAEEEKITAEMGRYFQ